ncbi:MAG: hypothetical protein U0790_16370 [Isosphaeraceae bacterium]
MAYFSVGYSLPDLRIRGGAGSLASWGGTLRVSIQLQNVGASTFVEPLSLIPPSQVTVGPDGQLVPPYAVPSSASAGTSQVGIYISPRPNTLKGALKIGTVDAPPLAQNDVEQFDTAVQLPINPVGLPVTGILYLRFVANEDNAILECDNTNNVSQPIPVRFIARALPQLAVTALDVPPVMQPGDTIAPTFQVTNIGSASTAAQGPVEVALVASTSPDFNLGSSIVALYTITDPIPGASGFAAPNTARHHRRLSGRASIRNNVNPGSNVITFPGTAVTLPTSPSTYYLGIVVDPNNRLRQLSTPANRLEQVRPVGPPIPGLPPAGVVSTGLTQAFPNPPDGVPIGTVNPASF